MNLRLHLLGALLACHSGALGGPVVSGNWASHLAAGEVEQMCRVAAGSSNFPVIKLDVYTSQAGYVDHEGDPPRHIVFAEVFFAAEQKHARYETGKALTIEKKEAAGPEGWTIEGRPNKWLQVNALAAKRTRQNGTAILLAGTRQSRFPTRLQ